MGSFLQPGRKPVVYIAGPFRGVDHWAIHQNVRSAEALALEVWRAGAVAICPHLNTEHFQGSLPDDVWLEGDLEILGRCDAVLLAPRWETSSGTRAEIEYAHRHGLYVLETWDVFLEWMAQR